VHTTIRVMLVGLLMTSALVACAQQPESASSGSNEVAARFGDQVITLAEVEEAAGGQLLQLEQQMFQVKDQQLRSMIFNALVDTAAAAEGISSDEYLKREITDKIPQPTDEQIKQVMDQYRAQLNPDEAQARQQVVAYLQQQGRAQQEQALKTRLFDEANVQVLLDPPRVKPVVQASNPSRGPADAPIVFIEYTDFQCPYCGRVQPTIDALTERYGDRMVHVFKNLPLPMHQQAELAAEAALCAGDQGKFWELHDWLFANKSNISRDTLMAEAGTLSLDVDAFGTCLDSRTHQAQVEADAAEANRFGIRGTPGFAINGRVVTGAQPFEAFVEIFDDELRRAGVPVPGTEPAEGDQSGS
jgi:protein-disulfide isomerase